MVQVGVCSNFVIRPAVRIHLPIAMMSLPELEPLTLIRSAVCPTCKKHPWSSHNESSKGARCLNDDYSVV